MRHPVHKALARSVVALLVASTMMATAAEMATLSGRILAEDGEPAEDFLVVVRDAFTGEEFGGTATASDGSYRVQVPAGSRYRLVAVVDPAGKRLAVEPEPELDVPAAGEYALPDATYLSRPASRRSGGATPWYRSAGGLVGLTSGGLALLVLALDEGQSAEEPVASPFAP